MSSLLKLRLLAEFGDSTSIFLSVRFDSGALRVITFCVMATYILIALGNFSQIVDNSVQASIPKGDCHQIESGKWLINSSVVTSKEMSDKLGLSDTATFMICPIRGYYGRARSDIWEWLAAKS